MNNRRLEFVQEPTTVLHAHQSVHQLLAIGFVLVIIVIFRYTLYENSLARFLQMLAYGTNETASLVIHDYAFLCNQIVQGSITKQQRYRMY